MEQPGIIKPIVESQTTYRIEHFPELDVVVNLDYSEKENTKLVLELLKSNPLTKDFRIGDLLHTLSSVKDNLNLSASENNKRFFIKIKREPKEVIDYMSGQSKIIPFHGEFDVKAMYGAVGVMNEIILSRKIKMIVSSQESQDLVKEYGFAGMRFAEPILTLVDKTNRRKYLIYKNFAQGFGSLPPEISPHVIDIPNLRRIFLEHGINPNDLTTRQLMIAKENNQYYIVLIDTEAYTEMDKSKS